MLNFFRNFLEHMGNDPHITQVDHYNLQQSLDGILVKKLTKTNTLINGRDSHQTHIAITGDEMNMFPWEITEPNVVDLRWNNNFKKNYVVRIYITLLENNIRYLRNENYSSNVSEIINTFTHTAKTTREDGSIQREISYLSLDDNNFKQLRYLLREDDYLAFLRKRDTQEYMCLGILNGEPGIYSGFYRL